MHGTYHNIFLTRALARRNLGQERDFHTLKSGIISKSNVDEYNFFESS